MLKPRFPRRREKARGRQRYGRPQNQQTICAKRLWSDVWQAFLASSLQKSILRSPRKETGAHLGGALCLFNKTTVQGIFRPALTSHRPEVPKLALHNRRAPQTPASGQASPTPSNARACGSPSLAVPNPGPLAPSTASAEFAGTSDPPAFVN
ncbi:hypothetical protein KM043_015536 [Ampulex compressa]|nr:hypothetical protein KM043_015536 [Ampulex compressa]